MCLKHEYSFYFLVSIFPIKHAVEEIDTIKLLSADLLIKYISTSFENYYLKLTICSTRSKLLLGRTRTIGFSLV